MRKRGRKKMLQLVISTLCGASSSNTIANIDNQYSQRLFRLIGPAGEKEKREVGNMAFAGTKCVCGHGVSQQFKHLHRKKCYSTSSRYFWQSGDLYMLNFNTLLLLLLLPTDVSKLAEGTFLEQYLPAAGVRLMTGLLQLSYGFRKLLLT
jgi:hypothetical protein